MEREDQAGEEVMTIQPRFKFMCQGCGMDDLIENALPELQYKKDPTRPENYVDAQLCQACQRIAASEKAERTKARVDNNSTAG